VLAYVLQVRDVSIMVMVAPLTEMTAAIITIFFGVEIYRTQTVYCATNIDLEYGLLDRVVTE
jgi:hypothetical protein